MAKLALLNIKGEKVKDITLKDDIWKIIPNDTVLFDAIRLYRASRRQGTSATKSRGMVRGSTRKIFRQKGTGNARQGSARAPHRTGGGVAFAKVTRDYSIKMNRKERKLALKSAVSYKVTDKDIVLLENFGLKDHKTKEVKQIFETLKLTGKIMIVAAELDEKLVLATRNLPNVSLILAKNLNTYEVVNIGKVVILEDAISKVEGVLS